jgi:uncharacterized protein
MSNPDPLHATVTADVTSRKFITRVFAWMFVALAVTSACVYAFNSFDYCMRLIFSNDRFTALAWLSLIAPFILSFIIRRGVNSISYTGLCVLFILYAALIGVCFSFILLEFVDSSLFGIFQACCLVFGIAGITSYTTKTDLTQFKPILYLLLCGLVIVTPVVFLLPDLQMNLWVSYFGMILFFGIAALSFGSMKETAMQPGLDAATAKRLAILSSLSLYADFVNLFFFVIGIFFSRKND